MIGKEETYIRDREVIIHSKRTIDELRVFIWKHGKAQAQSGYNDDLVMALAIGLWVRDTAVQLKQAGIDLNRKMLDSFTRIGITTGKDIKKPAIDPWKMKTGNGTDEDITWLIS
jgi:hypothetical protein